MLGTSDAWLMRRLPHWPSKPGIILKIVGFLESYAYFLPPHISPRFSNLATTLDYLLSKLWRWVGERKQIPLPFFVVCFLPLLRRAFLCIFAWNHIISYIQACMSAFKQSLLLNEGIPRAYRGKKLRLKNILLFPSENNGK